MKNLQSQNILHKEMDRKQFFKYVGAAVLAVSGVSGVLKAFGSVQTKYVNQVDSSQGFGGGVYGGIPGNHN